MGFIDQIMGAMGMEAAQTVTEEPTSNADPQRTEETKTDEVKEKAEKNSSVNKITFFDFMCVLLFCVTKNNLSIITNPIFYTSLQFHKHLFPKDNQVQIQVLFVKELYRKSSYVAS